MKKRIEATSVLMGTIIGVGLFSLPYIASKVGLAMLSLYFLFLGAVVVLTTWLYGEIALKTNGSHRLPGYARKYLGAWAEKTAVFSNALGTFGSLLAYLLIGSGFLHALLNPLLGGSLLFYVFLFFLFGAILVFFERKTVAKTEVILLCFLLLVLCFAFFSNFSLINQTNFFAFNFKESFLPYGAVLFALSGLCLVPEIKEILKGQEKDLKKVVLWGVLGSALVYLLFVVFVWGICGQGTSEEAISGLQKITGDKGAGLMFLFGILTTFTSYIAIGLNFKKMLTYDLKMDRYLAWAIVCSVPFLLYFFGWGDFLAIISLTGGVLMAIDVILVILIYLKIRKSERTARVINLSPFWAYSLILFFVLGAIYELVYFLI